MVSIGFNILILEHETMLIATVLHHEWTILTNKSHTKMYLLCQEIMTASIVYF